jgi:hypothetical protein
MQMLSEDDVNLRPMTDEELEAAWDLWFDLAQATNAFDPPYAHGVLVGWAPERPAAARPADADAGVLAIEREREVAP